MLNFLGTDLPIIQAPMAGVQDSRLALGCLEVPAAELLRNLAQGSN